MYSVLTERFGIFSKIKLLNELTGEYVSIIPEYGANVVELVLSREEDQYSIIEGCNSYKELLEDYNLKSANLAPFPNRIRNGSYTFQKKKYTLPEEDLNRFNGFWSFLFNQKFEIVSKKSSREEAVLSLRYIYNGNIPAYQFPFEIEKTFSLSSQDLFCNTIIKNTGFQKLPIGYGWQPSFRLGKRIDKLMLKVPPSFSLESEEPCISSGASLVNSKFSELTLIKEEKLDLLLKVEESEGRCVTTLYDPEEQITLKVWQDIGTNNYQYLHISSSPSRTSVLIKPMTCISDGFNNFEGLIVLDREEEVQLNYGVILE